jgi:hypothetical protein
VVATFAFVPTMRFSWLLLFHFRNPRNNSLLPMLLLRKA